MEKESKVQFNVRVLESVVEEFNQRCVELGVKTTDAAANALHDWCVSSSDIDLGARIIELESENQSLKDTLESLAKDSSEISHETITGRKIKNYGFGKKMNQAIDNIVYRVRNTRAGSEDHWATVINQFSSRVIYDNGRPFTPASPSKEDVAAMEKAASKS